MTEVLRAKGACVVAFCATVWLSACSLIVHPDELSEGCPEGMKACDGMCVSALDEEFGCARSGCTPCLLHQARAQCSAEGECVIGSCVGTWEDCDRTQGNGCEIDLDSDKENCGACGAFCEDPEQGEAACGRANCYVRKCDPPLADCNLEIDDGCEVDLSMSVEHCGSCETACEGACQESVCQIGH